MYEIVIKSFLRPINRFLIVEPIIGASLLHNVVTIFIKFSVVKCNYISAWCNVKNEYWYEENYCRARKFGERYFFSSE